MSGNFRKKKIALAGALMFVVTSVSAQTVKGVVTDNTGEPIIGASVMEVGVAGNGGVTDIDGNFTVNLKGKSKKLKISYIGMKAKEVSVAGKESIDVKLEDDNTTLNDVVVIGYGTVRKKDLTGSVSSISDKQIANIPVSNVSEAMTGKMAGVNITTTEGSPDADVKIRVRGGGSLSQDNSPLYIVDGFPVSSISDIAPSEIQSIDVLKDASSTAIYGARGANGVIIVTTKSGSEGKTQVNFNASLGYKKVSKLVKTDPHFVANATKLSFVLAAFHTTFNLANTFILVWFIPQIEKLVCKIIRPKKNTDEDDFRLRFIQSGIMKTPEISVLEAQKEIHCFAERIQRMFGMVKTLLGETNEEKFVKLYSRIEKYEGISDNMEIEIAKYLDQVSDSHLSDETKAKIRAMLREISEIESIGDSCFNIARTLNRRFKGKEDFITSQYEHMHQMMELTDNALTQMNITLVGHKGDNDANLSFNIENEINNYRNQLKSQNINDVNNHLYTYAIGTMYMDIIQECEKLGDYVVNVVEARMGVRQHEA